ncbi:MAG: hypothetical protein C0506_02820 [Anaerolinea sp.]|nr:hypothetical protein [Anaerolinea sp.]
MKVPVEEGYFRIPEDPAAPPVLLGSFSPAAKTYFWPRRKRCPITLEPVEDCELSTDGVIYSWTFVLLPWLGSMEADAGGGFGACQVDLPEGVRIQAPLDGKMGDWSIGQKVRLVTRTVGKDDAGNELCAIAFRLTGEGR